MHAISIYLGKSSVSSPRDVYFAVSGGSNIFVFVLLCFLFFFFGGGGRGGGGGMKSIDLCDVDLKF